MSLSEIIIQRIKTNGPISFCEFMEMALYFPESGYYNSSEKKIGKTGDFYTSPVLSALFGKMIGKQLEEMWYLLERKPFTIVEFGAGTGALCYDILEHLKANPAMYNELRYCIIEKSTTLRERQKSLLREKVSWYNSIDEISEINGCILSNEVLDNFAVHKVIMKEKLMEIFVDYDNGFKEILRPASDELQNYFYEQNIVLPKDYCTEVNLQAIQWLKEIASALNAGFVLTIDYGFAAGNLYSSKRSEGTLVCYSNHGVNNLPYDHIGGQDITAHVNFSALNIWGEKSGLKCTGFTTQDHFLRSLGLVNYLRKLEMENKDEKNKELIFQINKLLMDMGNKFKILIQHKGIKTKVLTGMQFADPEP